MGYMISKCKEYIEEEPNSTIVYNVPISRKEQKRRKYRFKKKIEKQYLIL